VTCINQKVPLYVIPLVFHFTLLKLKHFSKHVLSKHLKSLLSMKVGDHISYLHKTKNKISFICSQDYWVLNFVHHLVFCRTPFRNRTCFHPQVRGWEEASTRLGLLKRVNLNHWITYVLALASSKLLLALASTVILGSRSCGPQDHILCHMTVGSGRVNYCCHLPAWPFLFPSPPGLMTIFHCLTTQSCATIGTTLSA
jgi:hypothetical protein